MSPCKLSPVPRELVDLEQYQNIVRDWIYPSINQLSLFFIPSAGAAEKGFFVLEVSNGLAGSKPFLIVKGTDDSKKKDGRITFGYAERFRSNNLPSVVQRLQQLLHLGIRFENHEDLQQEIEASLAGIQTSMERLELAVLKQVSTDEAASQAERENKFEQNLKRVARELAMTDTPRLTLGAVPEQPVKMRSLFSSRQDGLVTAFENPPRLRDSGFDFALERPSEILQGSARRIAVPGYKSMELSTDGELIVIVPGDENFLAWGPIARQIKRIRINSFVLAEVAYLFALYVKNVFEFAVPKPNSIKLYIGLDNMTREGEERAVLSSQKSSLHMFETASTQKTASSSQCLRSVRILFAESAERMAFLLRAEIYYWFGFDEGQVPYSKEIDGKKMVTRDSLLQKIDQE